MVGPGAAPAPAGPPPPRAAVERSLGTERFPAALFDAAELHELHADMAALCGPARDGLVPLTVVSGGRAELGRSCSLLCPGRSAGSRGVLAGYLRGLAGPGCGADGSLSPPLELWCAACDATGAWHPLEGGAGEDGDRPAVAGDGTVSGVARHVVGSTHEGVELVERLVRGAPAAPCFLALGVGFRRCVPELGCAFLVSALWVDVGAQELEGPGGAGLESLREHLAARGAAGGAEATARPPHPLLELLAPALRGERALAVVTVGQGSDPATLGAAQLAAVLRAAAPEASPRRRAEVVSVRPGYGGGGGATPSAGSFQLLAGAFQDLCSPPASPLPELRSGELAVDACGFPAALLPSLQPYASRLQLSERDRWRLIEAAEAELAEFEENAWVVPGTREHADPLAPRPLFMHLADCYRLPDEHLTTTSARSYARSQDPSDPMVRTVRRMREDAALGAQLLPLAAAHPFNPVRLLRMGGIHSLLNLLADASALAPSHSEASPAAETLSPAEMAALALVALAAFAPVRSFLVSQCVFELLAITIKHPASDRHLLVFLALLTRLCQEPQHKRRAAETVAPSLVEQLPRLLARSSAAGGLGLAEAAAAAAASLSPCLPVPAFAPAVRHLLGHLCGSAPPAFHHLAGALATSLRSSSDLDLDAFVPRLLSLVPLDAPRGAALHGAAAGLLALCSHTAATTSLSRRWAAATAAAVARQALRSGPAGLTELRAVVPLAAAPKPAEGLAAPRGGQWDPQVEVTASMLATLRWTTGDLAAKLSGSDTAALAGSAQQRPGALPADDAPAAASAPDVPQLRQESLQGHARLLKLGDMAESPNHASFGERPQLRLAVDCDRAEVFLSLALLTVTRCRAPAAACGCGGDASAGCGGQLGLWLCELPCGAGGGRQEERRRLSHQLDLRPPIHASAAGPGETEHFASVTLTRGLYTLVPFSSHEVVTAAAPAAAGLRSQCRASGCGCVDLNLAQPRAWERGAHFAAVSVWAECAALEVSEAAPWHQRLELGGELLAQSAPVWLCAPAGAGPVEALVCVCSRGGGDEDPSRFRASEPCLDLWPAVPSRRVRNERTGALRVHLPAIRPDQPVRLACLWQEALDPARWRQAPPRLLVYSLAPLRVHVPALGAVPRGPPGSVCGGPPPQQAGRWQATAVLAGAWGQGMSSGFGSLRNPQVVLEALRPPGRGEELQVDLYLFSPRGEDEKRSQPSLALTAFARTEQTHLSDGHGADSSRLLEGQLRKELGSSKVVIGSYVTAQVVLSGAEARAPFFVVLQNSDPQEPWPWQLRVLARVRPGGKVASAGDGAQEELGTRAAAGEPGGPAGRPRASPGATDACGAGTLPDEPPLRCTVFGGVSEPGRVYACWPHAPAALYVPRVARGDATAAGSGGPRGGGGREDPGGAVPAAWVLGRPAPQQEGPGAERLTVAAVAGAAQAEARGRPCAWPPPQPLPLPPPEAADAGPPTSRERVPPGRASAVPGPAAQPAQGAPAGMTEPASAKQTRRSLAVPPPPRLTPRGASAAAAEAAPAAEAQERGGQDGQCAPAQAGAQEEAPGRAAGARRWRVAARDRHAEDSAEAGGALPGIERRCPPSERHARVAALQRRRGRGGYVEDGAGTPRQSSAAPPTPRQAGAMGGGRARGRADAADGRTTPEAAELPRAGGELPPLPSARGRAPPAAPKPQAACEARSAPRAPSGSPRAEDAAAADDPGQKCCHFSGHPVFCCRAEAQWREGPQRHLVRLQRRPGADRLGFGNVAAGPPGAPVLVISWIREGALAEWNAEAEAGGGLRVPPQSAILAVNRVSGDILKMREALREQVVEIEVITPDRWRYDKVVGTAS